MIPSSARVVRIQDTAHLEYLQASRSHETDIEADPDLERMTPWRPLELDESDNLMKFDPHEKC